MFFVFLAKCTKQNFTLNFVRPLSEFITCSISHVIKQTETYCTATNNNFFRLDSFFISLSESKSARFWITVKIKWTWSAEVSLPRAFGLKLFNLHAHNSIRYFVTPLHNCCRSPIHLSLEPCWLSIKHVLRSFPDNTNSK